MIVPINIINSYKIIWDIYGQIISFDFDLVEVFLQ